MESVKVDLLATAPKIFLLVDQQTFDPKLVTEISINLARTPMRPYLSLILVPLESIYTDNMVKVEVLFQQNDKPEPISMAFYLDNKLDIIGLMTPNCYVTITVCYEGNHIVTNRLLITKEHPNNSIGQVIGTSIGNPVNPIVPPTTTEPTLIFSPKIDQLDLLSNPFNLGSVTKTLFGRSRWRTTSIPIELPPPNTMMGTVTSPADTIVGCSIAYTVNGTKVTTMLQASTEMIFKAGDEFTIFMVVNIGPRIALEPYILIIFKQPGIRSHAIGAAIQAHVVKVEYVGSSAQSISLFHPDTKKHRKLFSFCVRKPRNKIPTPRLEPGLVKRPIM